MRKHSQSFGIYLIFGAIIAVFAINFGPGSSGCRRGVNADWAATVNGDSIRQVEFALEYERAVNGRRQANASLSDSERQALRRQIIEQLVQAKLVSQEADHLGLRATDEELLDYLAQTYRVDDVSYNTYQNWVRRTFQTTVAAFENRARDDIARRKLVSALQDNIAVGDAELRDDYAHEHDRAMVAFVKFDPQQIDVPAPSQKEIDALLTHDLARVQAHYDQEKYLYATPMRVSARQILRTLPRDAADADVARERGLLLDLRTQIEAGADFGALAQAHSQDERTTVAAGGDLGSVTRGQLIAPLEEAIFSLQPGEMGAEPVRSRLGLHLVKVEGIEPPKERSFDDVKAEAAASLLRGAAQQVAAEQQARALLKKLKAGKKLEALTVSADEADAEAGKPIRRESSWIQRLGGDLLPAIGVSQPLHDAVFALSKEGDLVEEPYVVGRAAVVVQLLKRETPDLERFEADKGMLREYRRFVKANAIIQQWLDELRRHADIRYNPTIFPAENDAT